MNDELKKKKPRQKQEKKKNDREDGIMISESELTHCLVDAETVFQAGVKKTPPHGNMKSRQKGLLGL